MSRRAGESAGDAADHAVRPTPGEGAGARAGLAGGGFGGSGGAVIGHEAIVGRMGRRVLLGMTLRGPQGHSRIDLGRRWREHHHTAKRKLFRPPSDSAPLARSVDNRVVAGVASGLATRFGIDPTIIRIGFVIAAVAGGSGLVAYAVLWVLLPVEGGGTAVIRAAAGDKRATSEAAAVGVFVLIVLFLLQRLGLGFFGGEAWPLSITAAALVLVWRVAGEEDRAVVRRVAAHLPGAGKPAESRGRRRLVLRVVLGVALILVGVTSLLSHNRSITALRDGVIATLGVLGGVALIFGPWWVRLGTGPGRGAATAHPITGAGRDGHPGP